MFQGKSQNQYSRVEANKVQTRGSNYKINTKQYVANNYSIAATKEEATPKGKKLVAWTKQCSDKQLLSHEPSILALCTFVWPPIMFSLGLGKVHTQLCIYCWTHTPASIQDPILGQVFIRGLARMVGPTLRNLPSSNTICLETSRLLSMSEKHI